MCDNFFFLLVNDLTSVTCNCLRLTIAVMSVISLKPNIYFYCSLLIIEDLAKVTSELCLW